uniref:Interleukin 1 receptor, type II n=1 Tax=Mus musculus TaxID=10090 RepID=A0A0A6YX23_MOUSE
MFILLVLVTGVSAFTTPTVVHTGKVSESPITSEKPTETHPTVSKCLWNSRSLRILKHLCLMSPTCKSQLSPPPGY